MHCGLWLLTGPFQMLLLQTDWQMFAPFGDVGRAYQCMEEPTPRLNEYLVGPTTFPSLRLGEFGQFLRLSRGHETPNLSGGVHRAAARTNLWQRDYSG